MRSTSKYRLLNIIIIIDEDLKYNFITETVDQLLQSDAGLECVVRLYEEKLRLHQLVDNVLHPHIISLVFSSFKFQTGDDERVT